MIKIWFLQNGVGNGALQALIKAHYKCEYFSHMNFIV